MGSHFIGSIFFRLSERVCSRRVSLYNIGANKKKIGFRPAHVTYILVYGAYTLYILYAWQIENRNMFSM